MNLTEYTLERTGNLPLTFEGEELASASSHRHQGPGQNRWHELLLYRTKGGRYAIAVSFHSRWQGEDDRHFAAHADTPEAVRDALKVYPVPPPGVGYPPGEPYRAKQERLEADLRRRFDQAVSDLFRGLPDGFSERVD